MNRIRRREFLAAAVAAGARGEGGGHIRPGCQTRIYGSPLRDRERLLTALDDLAALGFEGFETNFASLEHSFADPAPMRAEIARRGIGLIGLHASARFFDPEKAGAEREQVLRIARAVAALGGTHLMLSGPGAPDRAALERRAAELQRTGGACRELGVRLAIHNHARETEHDAAELRAILDHTGAAEVSLLLDLAYAHGAALDVPAFVRQYGPRIAGFHVRDLRGGREVELGSGEVDYAATVRALRESRWAGWFILEMNRRADISSRELARRARTYMKTKLGI